MLLQTLSLDDPRWPRALARTPHDVYHTPQYVRIDAQRMHATGEALLVTDGDRQLFLPYLLRSCEQYLPQLPDSVQDVISPYGYPGLLLNEAAQEASFAAAAWAAVLKAWSARGVCTAFLRMHPILGAGLERLFPPGTMLDSGETVAVDLLADEATMWKRMAESHRNRIRRCRRYGFTARFVPLGEVLDAFVEIYEQTMTRVGAKESYYFGRDYFTALAALPGVHCGIVESGTKIISACAFLESHGIVQAHLGGTATEHFAQSPFHLCWYQAMLWGKQRGNRWLHLGGGLGGINDQLLQFKARFSPQRFRFHTARIVLNEPQYLQLVERAALSTHCSPQQLLESKFFPAYRSEPPLR